MKVIVTGATGFIGTALCEELLQRGHNVTAVVRPGSRKIGKLHFSQPLDSRLQIVELALEELSEFPRKAGQADLFYHLAWNGSSGSERNDFAVQYSNIKYTTEAIRVAGKCGCSKFIGAGSQAEYGVVQKTAKEEETVPNPFMMYGAAKLAAYQMGRIVAEQEGISLVWPRIYSVYGVGENPGTLVNYVIETLQKGGVPELSPCENMWNFMYITDCVKALCLLGEREETQGVYHIASEDTRVLREFVEEIREIVAPKGQLKFGARESDPQKMFWLEPDVTKLKKLGFVNQVTCKEGIERKIKTVATLSQ